MCRAILPAWGAGPYLPALVLERPIFVREMSDGLYTAFTYLTYKVSSSPVLICRQTDLRSTCELSSQFLWIDAKKIWHMQGKNDVKDLDLGTSTNDQERHFLW